MPKRTDISSILIIGAGPIIIGQACEFDYSGVQACKALREEGYRVILVNPNPATIMTDPGVADAVYIDPITIQMLKEIIEKEQPDALLPTMGGQTALNSAIELEELGLLEKYNVELIGARSDNIKKAEDRSQFRAIMTKIGLNVPRSFVIESFAEAKKCLTQMRFPIVVRPSFTLGGKGGNVVRSQQDLKKSLEQALEASPIHQVLLEEYLEGWKEFEFEMMRDKAGNCVVVCSIENVNPMGVHTGDSITVAPALTLTDKEYQNLRRMAIQVMQEIGIDTGGANVQFAVNPENGDIVVIEINPRVSRSSALASKATGFPIAKISAKLAVGLTLDEIPNEITKTTYAAFEPSIDYIVTKMPRFSFDKFPEATPFLTTAMKSIGEVMSIGRTFTESLQKALVSLEQGFRGLDEVCSPDLSEEGRLGEIQFYLKNPTPDQLLYIAEAFREGMCLDIIQSCCHYDPWFLKQIESLVRVENLLKEKGLPTDPFQLRYIKSLGFSNERLADLTGVNAREIHQTLLEKKIFPVYKRVDTCAGEFPSWTPYLYSTCETNFSESNTCEASPSEREKVIILGSGPNRIGQGIEFDFCCVQASLALKESGYETVMVNCNPETVSTDYTVSDRLYFEPLQDEYVLGLIKKEQSAGLVKGVVVQLGGQTPLNLIQALQRENIPILGTSPENIDLAENRPKFSCLLKALGLKQPFNQAACTQDDIVSFGQKRQYPLILRPSHVIGGQNMEIIDSEKTLRTLLKGSFSSLFKTGPVLVEQFLERATEIDVDALYDGETLYIAGIMEHFEKAGVHSGDSTCVFPSVTLKKEIIDSLQKQTKLLSDALNIRGLINIQFAIQQDDIYVLEVNPRASRTLPFLSKARGIPFAKLAARVMAGEKLKDVMNVEEQKVTLFHVKMPVFSFSQLPGAIPVLNSQMKSTGEVMGSGKTVEEATGRAFLATLSGLPALKKIYLCVQDEEINEASQLIKEFCEMGFHITIDQNCQGAFELIKGFRGNIAPSQKGPLDQSIEEYSIIINTLIYSQSSEAYSIYRKRIILNGVVECTTLLQARGLVEALKIDRGCKEMPLRYKHAS